MISRRDFLKRSVLTAFSWSFFTVNHPFKMLTGDTQESAPEVLGRILFNHTRTYVKPDTRSMSNGTYEFNEVISLSHPITRFSHSLKNDIWFGMENDSFIQSQNIQLVQNRLNVPRKEIDPAGRLAEITVPFSEALPGSMQSTRSHQIFFYGSTHWVYGLGKDPDGKLYYLVIEDRRGESYYVNATHMRIIEDDELLPLSPELEPESKTILVDTRNQVLTAYENNTPVMISAISTGKISKSMDFVTPAGEYQINYKRPSRHMVHSDRISINDGELYGVPWVSYFTDTGIAFHGTYWHNDYSQPRSHGCVNMPIHAARWIYLWTDPTVPSRRDKEYAFRNGTRVKVI
ncbi:MAG: L,D-transpeptidase [Anaerolineaceae bacterium]|nr:L,D-transpeptidase [Anaerolineaceae bacterium]